MFVFGNHAGPGIQASGQERSFGNFGTYVKAPVATTTGSWQISWEIEILHVTAELPLAWMNYTRRSWPARWRIRGASPFEASWKVKNALSRAAGWGVKNHREGRAAWRVLVAAPHAHAWGVLTCGQSRVAWGIQRGLSRDAGWMVKNHREDEVTWRILTGKGVGATWRIQPAFVAELGWEVRGSLIVPSSWRIMTVVDHALTAKIFVAHESRIEWQLNAWEQCILETAWRIIGCDGRQLAHRIISRIEEDVGFRVLNRKSVRAMWEISNREVPVALFVCHPRQTSFDVMVDVFDFEVREASKELAANQKQFVFHSAR